MNHKNAVLAVYPEAIFEKGEATGFKGRKYHVVGIRIADNKWLIFKTISNGKDIPEESFWNWGWKRIEKRTLKKFES